MKEGVKWHSIVQVLKERNYESPILLPEKISTGKRREIGTCSDERKLIEFR